VPNSKRPYQLAFVWWPPQSVRGNLLGRQTQVWLDQRTVLAVCEAISNSPACVRWTPQSVEGNQWAAKCWHLPDHSRHLIVSAQVCVVCVCTCLYLSCVYVCECMVSCTRIVYCVQLRHSLVKNCTGLSTHTPAATCCASHDTKGVRRSLCRAICDMQ